MKGFYVCYKLVVNLRYERKERMNIETFACSFLVAGLLVFCILVPFYLLRQTNVIDNVDFNDGNILLPMVILFTLEAVMCLGVAWIDIAQSAMTKRFSRDK